MTRPVRQALRNAVAARARFRCEYCLQHEDDALQSHHVDHIISEKHDGETTLENLAYSCSLCNWMKGTDVATYDAASRMLIPHFNPRTDRWDEHFGIEDGEIVPRTAVGEATVRLLKLNLALRVSERLLFTKAGRYPG